MLLTSTARGGCSDSGTQRPFQWPKHLVTGHRIRGCSGSLVTDVADAW